MKHEANSLNINGAIRKSVFSKNDSLQKCCFFFQAWMMCSIKIFLTFWLTLSKSAGVYFFPYYLVNLAFLKYYLKDIYILMMLSDICHTVQVDQCFCLKSYEFFQFRHSFGLLSILSVVIPIYLSVKVHPCQFNCYS